jgi:hypothetical protein
MEEKGVYKPDIYNKPDNIYRMVGDDPFIVPRTK